MSKLSWGLSSGWRGGSSLFIFQSFLSVTDGDKGCGLGQGN